MQVKNAITARVFGAHSLINAYTELVYQVTVTREATAEERRMSDIRGGGNLKCAKVTTLILLETLSISMLPHSANTVFKRIKRRIFNEVENH